MRKSGKFVKQAVKPAVEKKPSVKSALMQTYFTSLLCLVLCVSMFLGTSYAWFTSEVVNPANEIYVGTLKVGLYKENGQNLADSNYKLFDGSIRWEPGYTALETIQIVNEGDLAFHYVLNFTDGTLVDGSAEKLADVAENFEVWVYNHYSAAYTKPDSYQAMAGNANWKLVGTLAEVLDGTVVLKNVMQTVRQDDSDKDANTANGTADGVKTVDTYTIALHMKADTNDAKLMGQKITLNVKLIAYQMAEETDSMNSGYDNNIVAVGDAKQLQTALGNSGNTLLADSIKIEKETDRVTMNGGVLDGNGKTVSYTGTRDANDNSVGVVTTNGGTVRNLTIQGDNGRALYITNLTSDLYVSNCTFSGAYSFNLNSANVTGYTMTFANTTFKSWTSYANVMNHAYFTDCKFEATLKPYGDTTLTNCTFGSESTLNVSGLQKGETITLVNCTYNGVLIEKLVLTAADNGVTVPEGVPGGFVTK